MRKVDLHLHTYASDGEWSPQELLQALDHKGIKIFSVTDHDDVSSVTAVAQLVEDRPDLIFIKGVEGTVTYRGREHHILTYGIDEKEDKLLELLTFNRNVREKANDALMTWLNTAYPQVSAEGYEAYDYDPYQGGWRAYSYLKDHGIIENLKDYFAKTKTFNYEKIFVDPEAYIPAMKALGYKTVLAHPPAYSEGDLYGREHLDYFRSLGMDGIECYSQYLKNPENAAYYRAYCDEYDMMITGGSDCHGSFAGRQIGNPDVDETMVKLKNLI